METKKFSVQTPADFKSVIDYIFDTAEVLGRQFVEGGVEAVGVVNCEAGRATIVTLTGDLGAGKTTLVQELAKQLGITEPITSPTFGIMKMYEVPDDAAVASLMHIDAYRIEDISEAGPLRLEELWQQPRTLVCIEWPERIQEILPSERIEISIQITDGEEREVVVR